MAKTRLEREHDERRDLRLLRKALREAKREARLRRRVRTKPQRDRMFARTGRTSKRRLAKVAAR